MQGQTAATLQTVLNPGDEIYLQVFTSTKCATDLFPMSNKMKMEFATSVATSGVLFEDISLFPNPNNGLFTVKGTLPVNASVKTVKAEILNNLGQLVQVVTMDVNAGQVDHKMNLGSNMADGTYMIRMTAGGSAQTLRFNLSR
jgi:hypothetical protein